MLAMMVSSIPRETLPSPWAERKARSARSKEGCLTCRIRRKKCDQGKQADSCESCRRLHIECLGYSRNRPEWLKGVKVEEFKCTIKRFLAENPPKHDLHAHQDPSMPFLSFEGLRGCLGNGILSEAGLSNLDYGANSGPPEADELESSTDGIIPEIEDLLHTDGSDEQVMSLSHTTSEGSISPSTKPERSPGLGTTTLKSLGRKTLDGLKRVVDSTGVIPELSHILGAFEKLQKEFEDQEARFQRHLSALSSIIEPHLGGTNASPNNNLMGLHDTIEFVRDALHGHTSAGKPRSRILDAKEHQRRFEEATDSFRNWTNEWIVHLVTNLEQKFEGLESRMRGLDGRVQGLASIMQGLVIR